MKKTLKVVLNICLCVSLAVSGCALPKKIDAKTNTSNHNSYLSKRKELKEERTEYSTTYQVGNGKKQIEIYDEPIRYIDKETGDLVDYDSTLEKCENKQGYAYENKQGEADNYMPEYLSADTPVITRQQGYSIEMYPKMEKTEQGKVIRENIVDLYGEKKQSATTISYLGKDKEAEIEYSSQNNGIKETIVLENMPSSNEFFFNIKLKNCFPSTKDNSKANKPPKEIETVTGQAVTIRDMKKGNIIGVIPAGNIIDSAGDNYSEECSYKFKMVKNDSKKNVLVYEVSLKVDAKYFEKNNLTYPVKIDPSLEWTSKKNIQDTFIQSGTKADTNFSKSIVIQSGQSEAGEKIRTYMKFGNLSELISGKYIEKATLTLTELASCAPNAEVRLHQVVKDFNIDNVTYNTKPGFGNKIATMSETAGVADQKDTADITSFVKNVAQGKKDNYGIAMVSGDENSTNYCKSAKFYSSEFNNAAKRPKLNITYFEAPTQAREIKISNNFPASDDMAQVSWTGVYSNHLDYVQYRLVEYNDETGEEGSEWKGYDTSTIIGKGNNDQSGNKILNLEEIPSNCYMLYLRGVDTQGNAGQEKGILMHVDGIKPVLGDVVLKTSIGNENSRSNYSNKPPQIVWYSIEEKHINSIAYSINGGAYKKISSQKSGCYIIPASELSGSGVQNIMFRAQDKSYNNTSKQFKYYYDITKPVINKSELSPETTQDNSRNDAPTISYSVSDNIAISSIEYKINNSNYKNAVSFDICTKSDGKFVIPEEDFSVSGVYNITIRCKDQAGNYRDEKQFVYNYRSDDETVNDYIPKEVIAQEIEGKTILSWKVGSDGKVPSYIRYQLYRGAKKDFVPSEDTLVNASIDENKYIICQDDSLNGESWFYKIRAVRVSNREVQATSPWVSVCSKTEGTLETQKELGMGQKSNYEEIKTYGNIQVNDRTGNLIYENKGIVVSAGNISMELKPTYNSQSNRATSLGEGFCMSTDRTLYDKEGTIIYIDQTGTRFEFVKKGEKYVCDKLSGVSIKREEQKQKIKYTAENNEIYDSTLEVDYCFVMEDGKDFTYYDKDGKIIMEKNSNNDYFIYTYDNNHGLLQSILTSTGRKIIFEYSYGEVQGKARLKTIWNGENHISGLSFDYDENGLKLIYEKGEGNSVRRTYFEKNANGDIVEINNPESSFSKISYSDGKVARITDAIGEQKRFLYNGNSCQISEYNAEDKEIASCYVTHDNLGRILTQTAENGGVTRYYYEDDEHPYEITKTIKPSIWEKLKDNVVEFYHDQKVSQTHYDENANITLDTDDNGNQTTYLYEDRNNEEQPTKVVQKEKGTDNVLSEQVYEYDDRGNETTVKDVINDVTTNKDYDESGNCVNSTTISKGEISNQDKFGYDNEGNETEVSHISGTVKENVERTYDQRGNVLREENKTSGIITSYVYNSFSEPIKIETMYPDGKTEVVEKEYDLGGRITKEKAADGTQTIYAYDKIGRVTGKKITKEDLVREENINYSYEDIVVSGGGDIETRYPNARKQTITNQNGTIISVEYYDSVGSVIRTYKNGIYTDYLNDDAGHAVATILRGTSLNSGIAKTIVKTYDTNGNITATISNPSIENKQYVVNKDSVLTQSVYDLQGNITEETDGELNTTLYQYNENNTLSKVISADKGVQEYQYNIKSGNCFKNVTVNARGYKSESMSNAAGQVLSQTDYGDSDEKIKTMYEYDEYGNKTRVIYGTGKSEVFRYNAKQQLYEKDALSVSGDIEKRTSFEYDFNGNVTKEVEYTCLNNTLVPIQSTVYQYDNFGKMTQMSEVADTATPTDNQIDMNKLTYSYDAEDRLHTISYPVDKGVKQLSYEYNEQGWLKKIYALVKNGVGEKTVLLRSYSYDKLGKVKVIRDCQDFLKGEDNYLIKSYTYDDNDFIKEMRTSNEGCDENLQSDEYAYDKCGNIVEKRETRNGLETKLSYEYDSMNRLVSSQKNTSNYNCLVSYKYDKVGNRIEMIYDGVKTQFVYNGMNQLIHQTTGTVTKDYEYDSAGNCVQESEGEGKICYEYTARNELCKVSSSFNGKENIIQENTYNGSGKRITKREGDTQTKYFYQNESLYRTSDKEGNTQSIYLYGNGANVIAVEDYSATEVVANTYVKDAQGSICQLTDDDGKIVAQYEYDDYGSTKITGKKGKNVLAYTGAVYDATTGDYYLNARYYSPERGSFLSQDTYRGEQSRPETWNLYAYCAGNPINYVDPSGHFAVWIAITAVVVAVSACVTAVAVHYNKRNRNTVSIKTNTWYYASYSQIRYVIYALPVLSKVNYIVAKNAINTALLFTKSKSKVTSPGAMDKQVKRGQAPKEVDRVDGPDVQGGKPHVHFKDGTALNNDGTVHKKKNGIPRPSNKAKKWLRDNGWKV